MGLPDGVASITPRDGVIPVLSLAQVAPALRQASDLTARAAAVGEASPERFLLGQVTEARTELLTQVAEADSLLAVAAELSDALPGLLGADGPKRYFLGAANLAELRGTGGFIGAYSVLTADRGRVSIGEFDSVVRLESARLPSDVDGPNRSYDRRYGRFGGAGYWQNINMTPDFPTAAEAMVNLYEHDTGERLDGAIVVDPFALQALLRITGAVDVPEVGTVRADDVVEVVSVASYELLDSSDRKPLLGEVAAAALERFLGQPDAGDLAGGARALAESAGGGHLLLYSTDAAVQESLEAVGVAGGLVPDGGDFLAVVGNNAAANKADFFVDRSVDYQVWLQEDGSATALVDVELTNETPTSGLPLDVIGPHPDPGLEAGDNLTYLSVFCAPGCDLRSSGTTDPADAERGEELGLPVYSTWETVPAGETGEVTHALHRTEGWQRDDDDGSYRLTVRNQPTARPSTLSVRIHLPPGAVVTDTSDQLTRTEGALVWSGHSRGRTATFDVAFTMPGQPNPVQRTIQRSVDWWREVLGD